MTEMPPLLCRPGTTDAATVREIFENGAYDLSRLRRGPDIIGFWRARQTRGLRPLIVDAGANIGAAAVYFHRAFPDAEIVAVEPEQANFDILSANATGLPIRCLRRALCGKNG